MLVRASKGRPENACIRRYEEGVIALDSEDLKSALKLAESTLVWAKSLVAGIP